MKSQMTRFALGAWWWSPSGGDHGESEARRDWRASPPQPAEREARKLRRLAMSRAWMRASRFIGG